MPLVLQVLSVRKLTLAAFVLTALFTSAVRLPAITCAVNSAPIGKTCKTGCCANKTCCAESQNNRSLPSTPAIKDTGASQQLVAIPTTNSVTIFGRLLSVNRVNLAIAQPRICARLQLAVLCTFLI